MQNTKDARLFLIGMDSVPLWVLKELSNKKGMEPFADMLSHNEIMDLESTMPPMTGPAWPSIYTGLDPKDHGVPDFFEIKPDYTPDLIFYDSEKNPPFWRELADSGKRCLVITPATDIKLQEHPKIDVITGFPYKAKASSAKLKQLMAKYNFAGEPDIEPQIKEGKMSIKEGSRIFAESVNARISIAEEMLASNRYDFVYVCFTETDRLQHFAMNLPNRNELILPIYVNIAKFIRNIKKEMSDGDAIMLVSDHGMQPIFSKFLINAWLISNGFAKLKHNVASSAKQSNKTANSYALREKLIKSKWRKVYDRMPHKAKRLASAALNIMFSHTSSGEYTRLHLFDFDMKNTKAFAAISNDPVATIWINDSRFNSGIVSKQERAKLKKEVIESLKNIKDPKGNKLFESVLDAEPYYDNTKKFLAPDILAEIKAGFTNDIFYFSKEDFYMVPEAPKSGDHLRNGVFGFSCKKMKIRAKKAKVTDIRSTVLSFFGIKNGSNSLVA